MKRKNDFVMQNVGGENLLMPIGAEVMDLNGFVTLNETGVFLWELLEKDRLVSELAASLSDKFNIDHITAMNDTKLFVKEITNLGLLEQ